VLSLTADDAEALDRAVSVLESALAATPPRSPQHDRHQRNLGHALLEQFRRDGQADALDRAVELLEDSSQRPGEGLVLAQALAERYERSRRPEALASASSAYRAATAELMESAPAGALDAAQAWGSWAFDRQGWAEAGEALLHAIGALQSLVALQAVGQHKEVWLARAGSIAVNAAYALARAGQPEEAALALEHGRGLMLTEALDVWIDEIGDPELRSRYLEAAELTRDLTLRDLRREPDPHAHQSTAAAAKAAFDVVLREVRRSRPGADPFRRAELADLWAAGADRPLVQVLASPAGGVALIVFGGAVSRVTPVWLPQLTNSGVRDVMLPYLRSLFDETADDGSAPAPWPDALDTMTTWLWRTVMEPVTTALQGQPRAVFVPCGPLAYLPLHAAWTEDPATPSGRRYALDQVLITYAPGARALLAAGRRAEAVDDLDMLAVSDPQPVSAVPLPAACHEGRAAAAGRTRALLLEGTAATRDAVLTAMGDYSLIHFACHGMTDPFEPMDSALLLSGDELLTVRDLWRQPRLRDPARRPVRVRDRAARRPAPGRDDRHAGRSHPGRCRRRRRGAVAPAGSGDHAGDGALLRGVARNRLRAG
jgi:hypothetical protein